MTKRLAGALLLAGSLGCWALVGGASSASAQATSPCPPGQPDGRPPGRPPNVPGQPDGRPVGYAAGRCNLRISSGSVARGERVQVAGDGYASAADVTLRLASSGAVLAVVGADANGSFATTLTVPADAPLGSTELVAEGAGLRQVVALEIRPAAGAAATPAEPRAAAAPSSGQLPRTGQQSIEMVLVGGGLVLVGTATVIAARRRRPTA